MNKDQLKKNKEFLEDVRNKNNEGRNLQEYYMAMEKATTVEEMQMLINDCLNNLGTIPIEFKQKLHLLESKSLPDEKIVDLEYKKDSDYQNNFQKLYQSYQVALANNEIDKANYS